MSPCPGAPNPIVEALANVGQCAVTLRLKGLLDAAREPIPAGITAEGIVVIKAQRNRSQDKNREDALARLYHLVKSAAADPPRPKPTKPTRSSQRRRVDAKVKRGQVKAARGRVLD